MKLTNPTDREMEAIFAREVAKLGVVQSHWADADKNDVYGWSKDGHGPWNDIPPYCSSADAVLPWLGKHSVTVQKVAEEEWDVGVEPEDEETRTQYFADMSFPRAAVIALLRAHGVEVEFTK